MTKEVLVHVSGVQHEVEGGEPVVLVTSGTYYSKNDKHFLLYEEIDDDGMVSKNVIKIGANEVSVIRKGISSSHMVFEEGKENLTYYDTPYGSMLMGITTSRITFCEKGSGCMELEIDYALSVDGNHMSDCNIQIVVTAK